MENKAIIEDLLLKYKEETLPMWKMKNTGDCINDFSIFTKMQGGGKSNDPKDTASKNMPPKADKDGKLYHTVNDITWASFSSTIKDATAERFYNMNEQDRATVISKYILKTTKNKAIDSFLTYIKWGSGSSYQDAVFFKRKYGYDLFEAVKKSPIDTFDCLLLSRIDRLKTLKTFSTHGNGWINAHLCFWLKFKIYC